MTEGAFVYGKVGCVFVCVLTEGALGKGGIIYVLYEYCQRVCGYMGQ